MGGPPDPPDTQTTKTEPWDAAKPYLKRIMKEHESLYDAGTGPQEYPGQTVIPFSQPTQSGLGGMLQTAQQPNVLGDITEQFATGIVAGGGLTQAQRDAQGGLLNIGQGPGTATGSGAFLHGSPYLENALDFHSDKIADRVNQSFSGAGRYGSAQHNKALGNELAGLRFGMLDQNYGRERGLMAQAEQGDMNRRAQALGGVGQIGNEGVLNALRFAGIAPQITAQKYAPFERQLQVGQALEGKQAEQVSDAVSRFDFRNMQPYTQLGLFREGVEGPAGMFRSQTSTGLSGGGGGGFNPMQMLGGGLGLLSMFGGGGAAGGGFLPFMGLF